MPLPAIANYGKALTLSPTLIPALYGRAKAHAMLGETDKALDDYKTILDNDRADIRAVIEMASCYMAEGDIHNAMDRCMLALDMLDDIECPRQLQTAHMPCPHIRRDRRLRGSSPPQSYSKKAEALSLSHDNCLTV